MMRLSPLLIELREVDAPGMLGMRSSSLSNKTVESRGLYFFDKKVMGFRGCKGVELMTVNANEESDGLLKSRQYQSRRRFRRRQFSAVMNVISGILVGFPS